MTISHSFKTILIASAVGFIPAAAITGLATPAMAQEAVDQNSIDLSTLQTRLDEAHNIALGKLIAERLKGKFVDQIWVPNIEPSDTEASDAFFLAEKAIAVEAVTTIAEQQVLSIFNAAILEISPVLTGSTNTAANIQAAIEQALDAANASDETLVLVLEFLGSHIITAVYGTVKTATANLLTKYNKKVADAKSNSSGDGEQENTEADDTETNPDATPATPATNIAGGPPPSSGGGGGGSDYRG